MACEPQRLIDEEETEPPEIEPTITQLKQGADTINCASSSSEWALAATFKGRAVTAADSVTAEKDHLLAFSLSKSLCLLADMERHKSLTELKAIRSATKSMVLVNSGLFRKTVVFSHLFTWFLKLTLLYTLQAIQKNHAAY